MVVYAALCKEFRRVYGKGFGKCQEGLRRWQKHTPKEMVANDIAGLGKKKQSVTPEAQVLAINVTKKFCIPDKKVSELLTLEDDNFLRLI